MLTFLLAVLAGALPFLLYAGHLTTKVGVSILSPILFVLTAIVLFRRSAKGFDPILKEVERHLAGGRRELAVKALEQGFALKRWNPLLPGQLHGQLGVLHYTYGDLDKAESELRRAGRFPWSSSAYLGCIYFKKNDEKAMRAAFDKSLGLAGKEPVAYALYAYCLRRLGRTKDAVDVLERGLKKTTKRKAPPDARLEKNLELLKEGKKMKPQVFGDKWAQFALEGTPGGAAMQNIPRHMRGFATRPGFRPGFRSGAHRTRSR